MSDKDERRAGRPPARKPRGSAGGAKPKPKPTTKPKAEPKAGKPKPPAGKPAAAKAKPKPKPKPTRTSKPAAGTTRAKLKATTKPRSTGTPRAASTSRGGSRPSGTRRPATPRRDGRPVARPRSYRAPTRVPLASSGMRMKAMMVTIAVLVSLFAGRLVQVQVFDTEAYAASASRQTTTSIPLLPTRGTITDRNGNLLAASEPAVAVTADPTLTRERAREIADILITHLGGERADYLPALTKPDTRFVYVAKKVPAHTYDQISADLVEADIYGIFRESDPIRTYPAGTVAANVIGFTGGDEGRGLAGFEFAYDEQLTGQAGSEVYESAPNGSRIPLGANVITPAVDGTSYQLTIDAELQWTAEQRLAEAVRGAKAESGSVVMLDVTTGEVLALANYPSFDATDPGKADTANLGNRALTDPLEPGSVQKVLTFAALADAGMATPDTRVQVPASVRSADHRITDSFAHGDIQLTARGVIAKSSNIGTVLMAREMPSEQLSQYLYDFGLGAPTGIELPGEAGGSVPKGDMASYTHDQIAFGQGLSLTPLQNAAALASVINGGVYHKPTIVASGTDAEGNAVEIPRTEPRRVISEEASEMVRDVTQSVLAEGGTGVHLELESYTSGGKTATAQRVDPSCGCYRGYTASWMQYAPADDPKVLVLVTIDRPIQGRYGGTLAGPVAKDLLNYALPRFSIPPQDDPAPPDEPLDW
ncbi:MAG: penicillin-binding protein 2 [Propionibacterium sp.]|nr:penicillin-binding protein 2 [Propionibacterium sp.]